MAKHILLVDDESRIQDVVEYALTREGYRVTCVDCGKAALERLSSRSFDLVILDVMLPDIDGLSICRQLRATSQVPILFLSAKGDEVDRIVGLELGADDYMVKPFSPRELLARVRAVLRRFESPSGPEPTRARIYGALELDPERHETRYAGQRIELTATEFAILLALYERPGVVLSRGQLMEKAYPVDIHVTERTLDTHVRRIRAKFRTAGGDPITTVHAIGYKACES
ncbi:MAG: response regulator transcription factor [Polyangiaceae bacterium]|nr:response regulator transcription factor [Polyangiaceae bacterium]